MKSAVSVTGCEVNRVGPCKHWTAEVRMPLAGVAYNTTANVPPHLGDYWRINFSRVEWKVKQQGNGYELDGSCKWPCPSGVADNPGDNWVWAPTGAINVHMPDYWGYLQFADGAVNGTAVKKDPDYTVRTVAMQVYYANHLYQDTTDNYTASMETLQGLAPRGPHSLDGTCTQQPEITLGPVSDGHIAAYNATVVSKDGKRVARISSTGLLTVHDS